MTRHNLKMKSAWLITWEWIGDHARMKDKVVAILNRRLSDETVRRFIEQLYILTTSNLTEKVSYARNRKNNPYQAEFNVINGIKYGGQIMCGHNPHLYGRIAKDISIEIDKNGKEILMWKENDLPSMFTKD